MVMVLLRLLPAFIIRSNCHAASLWSRNILALKKYYRRKLGTDCASLFLRPSVKRLTSKSSNQQIIVYSGAYMFYCHLLSRLRFKVRRLRVFLK
ncbi:hypothetical protein JOB18_025429 [Solea senegalensis]|uniref:Secreted protein n=1 Tax=Solea senegalensis TaxID=28829 RepID=A0AAV6SZM2_SOLSE|nr:hypothetical protein JOB18_025429 [Solea senegalensis]